MAGSSPWLSGSGFATTQKAQCVVPNSSIVVMAGLDPAIYSSQELVVKVVPLGILGEDKIDFPGARPMFHVMLTLDGRTDIVVELAPDKHLQSISLSESFDYSCPVLATRAAVGCL